MEVRFVRVNVSITHYESLWLFQMLKWSQKLNVKWKVWTGTPVSNLKFYFILFLRGLNHSTGFQMISFI